jgi:hypothetical protein
VPTVTIDQRVVKPGDVLNVGGTGWPKSSTVKVEICGNNALNGTGDCDQPSSGVFGTWGDGTLHAKLSVVFPPKPCPCVVHATTVSQKQSAITPVGIVGAQVGPAHRDIPTVEDRTPLVVVKSQVESSTSLTSFFGGAADRTLVITVHNPTQLPVDGALALARWGKDDLNHLIQGRHFKIGAEDTVTVRLPFQLDALSFGSYVVGGRAGAIANSALFKTDTSQWPWGLVIVLLIILALIVFFIVRAVRRANARKTAGPDDATGASVAGEAGGGLDGAIDETAPTPVHSSVSWSTDPPDTPPG